MDYLDQIYLDNSLKDWLIVIGTIIIALLVKRLISKLVAAIIYQLVKKAAGYIEKKKFSALVIKPLENFLFLLIAVLAIQRLNYPEAFHLSIYNLSVELILKSITIAIVIFYFIRLLLSFINFVALVMDKRANITPSASDNQLVYFITSFLKAIIIMLGGVLILKFCFGARIGELITGLSIVGAALALAARESLENLIASFIIFFDKPFTAGDLVRVQNFTGFVERIGLRSTRIRTFDKNLVTVPNKQMVDSMLDNWSLRTNQRMEIRFELSPKTPADKLNSAVDKIRTIVESHKPKVETYTVYLTELNKNGALIISEYFTAAHLNILEFNQLRQDIYIAGKLMIEDSQIELMGPGNPVTVLNENKE